MDSGLSSCHMIDVGSDLVAGMMKEWPDIKKIYEM
jgi:hypothetical protein